jgi:Na+/proline symporter
MGIGLMLFIFLVVLVLLSIAPLEHWRLAPDNPLDIDDLRWPEAGYGSASVSLNCLFGAYSAILLLVGFTCFAGIVIGVVSAVFVIQIWISNYTQRLHTDEPRFQFILFNLSLFKSTVVDRAFWILVVFCQIGLAVSELVLLRHVFAVGLNFSAAHATVASLAIACVAYYYCLFGGYQALFRADVLQYLFIVAMGIVMIIILSHMSHAPRNVDSFVAAVRAASSPNKLLMSRSPHLRTLLELLSGFALGAMPILAAPDAWKRVVTISRRKHEASLPAMSRSRLYASIESAFRMAPFRLLIAAALPLALIIPLLMRFSGRGLQENFSFPIRELFALAPTVGNGFILLGMISAFMSTFDGALLSATHVLLGLQALPEAAGRSGLARYRVLFGLGFAVAISLLVPLVLWLPNPYSAGAILVAPFAIVAGTLLGTSFGARRAAASMIYLLSPVLVTWVFLTLNHLTDAASAKDPYGAVPLVAFGCCVFFLVAIFSRILSRANEPKPSVAEG